MAVLPMTTSDVAAFLGGRLIGRGDVVIRGMAKIEDAGPHDLSFVANAKYVRFLETTNAAAVLIAPGLGAAACPVIEVSDPYMSFVQMLDRFSPRVHFVEPGVHPTATVAADAVLGADVAIGAFSFIGPRATIGSGSVIYPHSVIGADVQIGEQCEIHSHVSLREGVRLGNRVIVQDGAVIGSDGFGFAPDKGGYRKIPQRGIVVIADDVEIGANTTIDRATIGETVVGRGTKLDNLIQVGHNAAIGANTVIAAQTGISGSSKIGERCRIGGQVGIVGHLQIGNDVMIGAQSGVSRNTAAGDVVSGSPARSHALWRRIEAALNRVPDLFRRVRRLESAVFGGQATEEETP